MSAIEEKRAVTVYPFWYGGLASCVAAAATHPLDLAKARMQASKIPHQTMVGTLWRSIRDKGILSIYDGLSASILRQATYSTVRFGVYDKLKAEAQGDSPQQPPIYVLLPLSMIAGFTGSIVGNPADLANVRMQNDRLLPESQRRNYKNALDAVFRIYKEEGFRNLFRGAGPNSIRGILMTGSQVVSYDLCKELLVDGFKWDPSSRVTFFTASTFAGFVATTMCSPVDVVKTRAMNSNVKMSLFKTLVDSVRVEGPSFMFRGWTPAFIRLAPQTIITFIAMEQLRKWGLGATTVYR